MSCSTSGTSLGNVYVGLRGLLHTPRHKLLDYETTQKGELRGGDCRQTGGRRYSSQMTQDGWAAMFQGCCLSSCSDKCLPGLLECP